MWHNLDNLPGVNYIGRAPNIFGEIHGMFTAYANGSTTNISDIFASGCFEPNGAWNRVTLTYQTPAWFLDGAMQLKASKSSPTYGRAHQSGDDNSIIPRSLSCRFYIKYTLL